jgi:Fic family protein
VTEIESEPLGYQPIVSWDAWGVLSVASTWSDSLSIFETSRAAADASQFNQLVRAEMRKAALETGAIEGLYSVQRGITRSVAMEGALWEAKLDEIGPDVLSHFAAQLDAFEMTLDFATSSMPITEAWIRELHAVLCRNQKTYRVETDLGPQDQPLELGTYKKFPNNVTLDDGSTHWYAPVEDVAPEMVRLVTELRRPDFETGHVLLQAAYCHHAFTSIHPFADGNGRVARALASVFLYRAAGIPLVVFSDEVEEYFGALADADVGHFESMVRFIEDRAVNTINTVTIQLRASEVGLEDLADSVRGQFLAHGNLSFQELRIVGERLLTRVNEKCFDRLSKLEFGTGVSVAKISTQNPVHHVMFGSEYLGPTSTQCIGVSPSCGEPVSVGVTENAVLGVAVSKDNPFVFSVAANVDTSILPLKVKLAEVHPAIRASTDAQIDSWVDLIMGKLLAKFNQLVRKEKAARGLVP